MSTSTQPRSGDKTILSPEQRPQYRETPDTAGAAKRLIRSIGKRISTEDVDDLTILLELDAELQQAWRTAIVGLRHTGYTDSDIGRVLGTTKQAVAQRWPRSLSRSRREQF